MVPAQHGTAAVGRSCSPGTSSAFFGFGGMCPGCVHVKDDLSHSPCIDSPSYFLQAASRAGAAPISRETLEYFGQLGMMIQNVKSPVESRRCACPAPDL